MARRSRKPFQLGLDPTVYNAQAIQSVSDKDLQHEYARMRREALDRLRGFQRSSEFHDAAIAKRHYGMFRPAAELSRANLERLTIEASKFLLAKASSVSGQREIRRKAIATFHQHGYTWVNTKNYKQFTDFLDWVKGQDDGSVKYRKRNEDDPGTFEDSSGEVIDPDDLKEDFEYYLEVMSL